MLSADGARGVVSAVLEVGIDLDTADVDEVGEKVLSSARRRINFLAKMHDVEPTKLACTMVFAIIPAGGEAVVGQVGDSYAVVLSPPADPRVISPPARVGYANETTFVSSAGAEADLRVERVTVDEGSSLVFFSDGLRLRAMDDLATFETHRPFFESVAKFANQSKATSAAIERYLKQLDDGTGDDLTLVLAACVDTSRSEHGDESVIGPVRKSSESEETAVSEAERPDRPVRDVGGANSTPSTGRPSIPPPSGDRQEMWVTERASSDRNRKSRGETARPSLVDRLLGRKR